MSLFSFSLEGRKRITVASEALDQINRYVKAQMTRDDLLCSEDFVSRSILVQRGHMRIPSSNQPLGL